MDFWERNSICRWVWMLKQKNRAWTEWKQKDKFTKVFVNQLKLVWRCFGGSGKAKKLVKQMENMKEKWNIFELWLTNGNGKELMECMSGVKCRQLYGADFIQSLLWTNSELQGVITRKARKKLNFLSICEFSGVQKRIIGVQVNVVR